MRTIAIILGLVFASNVFAGELDVLRTEAEQLYRNAADREAQKEAKYLEAAEIYAKLSKVSKNGYTYFNLGNALYRGGEKTKALAAYLSAQKLLPRSNEVAHNISILRDELRGGRSGINAEPHPAARAFFFWHYYFSGNEIQFICILLCWLIAGVLLYWGLRPKHSAICSKILIGLACLFVAFLSSVLIRASSASDDAVVFANNLSVRSEPSARAVELFQLNEGAEIRVIESTSNWSKIDAGSNRRGWADSKSILQLKN